MSKSITANFTRSVVDAAVASSSDANSWLIDGSMALLRNRQWFVSGALVERVTSARLLRVWRLSVPMWTTESDSVLDLSYSRVFREIAFDDADKSSVVDAVRRIVDNPFSDKADLQLVSSQSASGRVQELSRLCAMALLGDWTRYRSQLEAPLLTDYWDPREARIPQLAEGHDKFVQRVFELRSASSGEETAAVIKNWSRVGEEILKRSGVIPEDLLLKCEFPVSESNAPARLPQIGSSQDVSVALSELRYRLVPDRFRKARENASVSHGDMRGVFVSGQDSWNEVATATLHGFGLAPQDLASVVAGQTVGEVRAQPAWHKLGTRDVLAVGSDDSSFGANSLLALSDYLPPDSSAGALVAMPTYKGFFAAPLRSVDDLVVLSQLRALSASLFDESDVPCDPALYWWHDGGVTVIFPGLHGAEPFDDLPQGLMFLLRKSD